MTLADRRIDAPREIPSFNFTTPTRYNTQLSETLPAYVAEDNADVITTSIEVEEDDIGSLTPIAPTTTRRTFKGLLRRIKPTSPGVRIAPSLIVKYRNGFPLTLPEEETIDIHPADWMNLISRINILLANSHTSDIQLLIDSHPAVTQSANTITYMKLSKAIHLHARILETSAGSEGLTVPELNPGYESDESSVYDGSRRGSSVSVTSTTSSSRSTISQRIRAKFKDEWCLLID